MPKKYKQKSLLTKPGSSAPSNLSLSKAPTPQNVPPTKTVNDLIHESRRSTGGEGAQAAVSASSIHPSLRAVLDMPAPPPPAPRLGIRGPTRLRRIPGPPPPKSWLTDSIHAPREVRDISWTRSHGTIRLQKQSSNLPEGHFPSDGSLQQVVLKRMASHWAWHAEYDHEYLAELPTKIKQTLLSYIAIFSEAQGPPPLRLLFPVDLSQDELDEVRRLDLGNCVPGWYSLKRIERELDGEKSESSKQKESILGSGEIPEAWDEDHGTNVYQAPVMVPTGGMRFNNLKHLSLAVAPGTTGSIASWSALLGLVSKLSTITSLSLAYWPQPTYTPNASTGMVKVGHTSSISGPSTTYGGTNFYSAFDNDWREAAGILRTLSRSLYCLNWLDLTGCGSWFPALVWEALQDEDSTVARGNGPDWNGSWRGIQHLILAVGWSPGDPPTEPLTQVQASGLTGHIEAMRRDQTDSRALDLLSQLSSVRLGIRPPPENPQPENWNVEFERVKYYYRQEVARHNTIQQRAKEVAQKLRAVRKEGGGKWIDVDFGSEDT